MESKFKNDRHFEESIVQALIVDHPWAEQMIEVLDLDYFNLEHLKETTKILFEYYGKYDSFPSFKLLVGIVKDHGNKVLKEQIFSYLLKIRKEPLNGDLEYVKEFSLDFCKKRSLANALEASLDLIQNKKYDQIVDTVQKALMAGSSKDIGHIYVESLAKRTETIKRNPIPTPWPEVNGVIQGGLSGGELGVIMACTGVGKSHSLVDIGQYAACMGYNVAHYTLELSDIYVGKRYDARISGVSFNNLPDHKDIIEKSLQKVRGKIVIKAMPVKSTTYLGLKTHINQLTIRDMKPDVIIVDAGDLMKSTRSYDQKRLEEEAIFEELRKLSQELDIPIWTVTQSNREGLDVEVLTLKHVAECFGKAQIADFFMTMARNKDNTENTVGNFFIAKNRLGPDGIKYPILMNTGLSKIEILNIDENNPIEEEDAMSVLKRRYQDFKRNGGN